MAKDIIGSLQSTIDETIDFYKDKKIVIDLWKSNNEAVSGQLQDTIISKFFVSGVKVQSLDSDENISGRIKLINNQAIKLQDAVADILDNNDKQVDENVLNALDMILSQIERFCVKYNDMARRFQKNTLTDEILSIDKKRVAFFEMVQKSFLPLFDETMSSVFRGMVMTQNPIYDILLGEINSFFKNVGIGTKEVKIGEKMNFDYCEYADEASSKETENFDMDDCIYEIKQYPYFMSDEFLVSPGKVCTWRLSK